MNQTYYLDKIYNQKYYEFENIIEEIISYLKQTEFTYTYHKKEDNWIIEIEKENSLISIIFNDNDMYINDSINKKSVFYSTIWQRLFTRLLKGNLKQSYKRRLLRLEKNTTLSNLKEDQTNKTVSL